MTGQLRRGAPLGRERGGGTLLWLVALLLLGLPALAALFAVAAQVQAHRVQGAADLVAIAGAQAKNSGTGEPCAAAGRQATASGVRLVSCEVAGDQLSFVVTARVSGGLGGVLAPVPLVFESAAHAGVREMGVALPSGSGPTP